MVSRNSLTIEEMGVTMKKFLIGAALASAVAIAGPAAMAAPLTVNFPVVLGLDFGADPAGLSGAQVDFSGTIADGTVWGNKFDPTTFTVDFISHSFTITGANVAANNGSFSDPNGATFRCGAADCLMINAVTSGACPIVPP
jgi:hypothetical protein